MAKAVKAKKTTRRDLIESILKNASEPFKKPITGDIDSLELAKKGYTLKDQTKRFSARLELSEEEIYLLNKKMNKAFKCPEDHHNIRLCPKCRMPIDSDHSTVDSDKKSDVYFCKNCGQKLKRGSVSPIGVSLKEARLKRNIKLKDLANSINKSDGVVSRWEHGKTNISTKDIENVLDYYKDLSVEELLAPLIDRNRFEPKPLRDEKCPCCENKVYSSIGEALTIGLDELEDVIYESDDNDGNFCIYCGQALDKGVKRAEDAEFSTFSFWIERALKKS